MIKLIATDLDGTLLNEKGNLSRLSLEAIRILQDKGIDVIFASGRVSSSVEYFMKEAGLKGCLLANNGAIVLDEKGQVVFERRLGKRAIIDLIDLCQKYDIVYQFYTKDTFHSTEFEYAKVKHMEIGENKYSVNFCIRKDLKEYVLRSDIGVLKFFLYFDPDTQVEFMKDLEKIDDIDFYVSGKTNLDIVAKGVNKFSSLAALAEKNGYNIKDIIAIGDYDNDIEMVENCGFGIAMGNGVEKLKKIADFVTLDNRCEGFYHAVKEMEKRCLI